MNKEQQGLLDEAYKNYFTKKSNEKGPFGVSGLILTKQEFINKCKTDSEFSEKWGLKIEERELGEKERIELAGGKIQEKYPALVEMSLRLCDERDIPTKLITITYNNEKIENHEKGRAVRDV